MNYIIVASDTYDTLPDAVDVPYENSAVYKDDDPDTIYESITWY